MLHNAPAPGFLGTLGVIVADRRYEVTVCALLNSAERLYVVSQVGLKTKAGSRLLGRSGADARTRDRVLSAVGL